MKSSLFLFLDEEEVFWACIILVWMTLSNLPLMLWILRPHKIRGYARYLRSRTKGMGKPEGNYHLRHKSGMYFYRYCNSVGTERLTDKSRAAVMTKSQCLYELRWGLHPQEYTLEKAEP